MNESEKGPLEIYSNAVSISASVYDMVLDFRIGSLNEETKPLVRLRMSPQHAKAFFILLEKHIRGYEQVFGDINLPEDLVKSLQSGEPTVIKEDDNG